MNAIDLSLQRLCTEEGFRAHAYRDLRGFLTIGYGFNIDAGISEPQARALLQAQLSTTRAILAQYYWWVTLDDVRASVVIDVAFNVGIAGLLHFPKMLQQIADKNWNAAAVQLLNSDAARELPARYKALADILASGQCATQLQSSGATTVPNS